MRKNNLWITALAFGLSLSAYGQEGGISSGMLQEIKQAYKGTPADKAIHNAIAATTSTNWQSTMTAKTISTPTFQTK